MHLFRQGYKKSGEESKNLNWAASRTDAKFAFKEFVAGFPNAIVRSINQQNFTFMVNVLV